MTGKNVSKYRQQQNNGKIHENILRKKVFFVLCNANYNLELVLIWRKDVNHIL